MSIFVLKFGGKTIANVEKLRTAAQRVQDCLKEGKKVVVVVSAMADETDKLIEFAANIDGCGYKRELDHLLFTAEVKSASLFSMVLLKMGIKAKSLDFTTLGIKTNDDHFDAKVKNVDPKYIKMLLDEGVVPVIPGYQGITDNGEVTTLGRGGSDITAVAIAAALRADTCVLFKDVGAIYNDDPKVNQHVVKYDKITYDTLYDIANRGGKVVCRASIAMARDNNLTISIADPENFNIGTLISNN
jgi:aspartate kinase